MFKIKQLAEQIERFGRHKLAAHFVAREASALQQQNPCSTTSGGNRGRSTRWAAADDDQIVKHSALSFQLLASTRLLPCETDNDDKSPPSRLCSEPARCASPPVYRPAGRKLGRHAASAGCERE